LSLASLLNPLAVAFQFHAFGLLLDLFQLLSMFAGEFPNGLPQFVEPILLGGCQLESLVHGGSQLHSAFSLGNGFLTSCVSGLLLFVREQIVQLLLQLRTTLTEFLFQCCDFCLLLFAQLGVLLTIGRFLPRSLLSFGLALRLRFRGLPSFRDLNCEWLEFSLRKILAIAREELLLLIGLRLGKILRLAQILGQIVERSLIDVLLVGAGAAQSSIEGQLPVTLAITPCRDRHCRAFMLCVRLSQYGKKTVTVDAGFDGKVFHVKQFGEGGNHVASYIATRWIVNLVVRAIVLCPPSSNPFRLETWSVRKTKYEMRRLTTKLALLLVAVLLIGCGDRTRATRSPTPPKDQASEAKPESVSAENGKTRSPVVKPAHAILGTWDFDPEAMRKTSEFRQQIELLESRGYPRRDASQRAESAFATLSTMKYVITDQTISIGKQDHYLKVAYRIESDTEGTVVIKSTEGDKAGNYTTIRIVDKDHMVVSDDSRPNVPVWTFKRAVD